MSNILQITPFLHVRDLEKALDLLTRVWRFEVKTLPAGDVDPLMDKSRNQREFHVRLPDGHWLAFGQPVEPD